MRTVFQSYALFPHMTVQGNIAFPLKMARTPAAEIRAQDRRRRSPDVRLTGFGHRFPHELSGGQQQRVAIAPRARHPSDGAAARRAARRARRQAARADADRAHQPAEGSRHHVHLRDARPDRGARPLAPHRGDEPGPRRAARRARSRSTAFRRRVSSPTSSAPATCSTGPALASATPASSTLDVPDLGPVKVAHDAPRPRRVAAGAVALRPEKIRLQAAGAECADDNRFTAGVASSSTRATSRVYIVTTRRRRARSRRCLPTPVPDRAKFFEVGDARRDRAGRPTPATSSPEVARGAARSRAPGQVAGERSAARLPAACSSRSPALIMVLASFRTPGEFGGLAPLRRRRRLRSTSPRQLRPLLRASRCTRRSSSSRSCTRW